nr:HEPN domain-containing protein [uncultured Allomuricauda sp.]
MDTNLIKTKFEQADQFLEAAQSELNRPAEDVVPYMVCRSARKSISHYLKGYLLKHGVESNEDDTVEVLLNKCQEINEKFNDFDLSPLKFNSDDEYSAEFDEMQNCIDLAAYAKELVDRSKHSI